jgi:hypothetical protein
LLYRWLFIFNTFSVERVKNKTLSCKIEKIQH